MSTADNAAAKQLMSDLDAFRRAIESSNSTQRITLETTTQSDLHAFLQQRDKSQQLHLTVDLFPIKNVFDLTYKDGKTWGLEEAILKQLYGSLRCVLIVGHKYNKSTNMPHIADLLGEIGRSIQIDLTQDHDPRGLWDCAALISAEIVRFFMVYISKGAMLYL